MKTQDQLCYEASRKYGERLSFIDWLGKQGNAPTKDELKKLKDKNPVWNSYPESFCKS